MVWVIEVILAVVFLCWFGNAMASRYRGIYGSLPAVNEPEPKYPVQTVSPGEYYESACTVAMTAVCSSGAYRQVFRRGH